MFRTLAPFKRQGLAALLALALTGVGAADPKASKLYEEALVRYENKDMKGAVVQLKNAIRLDRNMLQAQVLLGRALLADNQPNAAEAALEEALRLGVNPFEVLLPLAETFVEQGKLALLLEDARFDDKRVPQDTRAKLLLLRASAASDLGRQRDALKLLEDARAIESASADSWAAEVPVRLRAKQLAEARTAADKAVALDPKSTKATYQRATVSHVTGDLQGAVSMYSRTLQLKPDHVDAMVARAGLYIDLNQIPAAKADVDAARKLDPRDPRAAYLFAVLTEKAGNTAEARKALNEVTNLIDPIPTEAIRFRPQLLMLGGMSHYGLEQFEKAQPYLEMVIRQDASSPVAKLLANVYLRQRQTEKAVEVLDGYLRAHPEDQQATLLLATTNRALGRNARAAQLSQEALKKGDSAPLRAALGMSLAGAGKFASSVTELEAALQKDPGQIAAGVTLVNLYMASNQGSKAVVVAEKLAKRMPDHAGLSHLLGTALVAKGDLPAARAAFERSAKLDPNLPDPVLGLARLEIQAGAYDAAYKRLSTLLTRNDKNLDAMMEVARLFSLRGQPDESERWLQRADDNSGPRLEPGLAMIDFQLARGRIEPAREALRRLQGKAPEALLVMLASARVQIASGDLPGARSTLSRAATNVAYDPAALTQIADMQVRAGNLPGAAHALDKALNERPTHLRARVLRSNVYLLQGDAAKAEQVARNVISTDPKSGLGWGLLGDIARSRGQLPAAIENYRKAHELERTSDSLMGLFTALDGQQHAAAVSVAQQWLREQPGDVRVWRVLGDSETQHGNLPSARRAYESLLQRSPRDADALNNLAIVLVGLKDPSAVKTAEQALALKPQAAYVIGTTGWAAFHAGQPDRALQLLRDARLRDPDNANTRYFLATVLAQQGRKGEARQELQAALQSGTAFSYGKAASDLLKTLN